MKILLLLFVSIIQINAFADVVTIMDYNGGKPKVTTKNVQNLEAYKANLGSGGLVIKNSTRFNGIKKFELLREDGSSQSISVGSPKEISRKAYRDSFDPQELKSLNIASLLLATFGGLTATVFGVVGIVWLISGIILALGGTSIGLVSAILGIFLAASAAVIGGEALNTSRLHSQLEVRMKEIDAKKDGIAKSKEIIILCDDDINNVLPETHDVLNLRMGCTAYKKMAKSVLSQIGK